MKRVLCLALFVAACSLTGCGAGGVDVDGKVVKDGSAYSLAEGEAINISLQGDGASGNATVNKDGTFVAKKSDGKALPPGQYKVSLTHYPPTAAAGKGGPPQPKTKTAGETWDVSSSNKSFTLDISKYK